jgi:hypothetical protein
MPPPPSWFRVYEGSDEAKWMTATQRWANGLFEGIWEAPYTETPPGKEAGVPVEGEAVAPCCICCVELMN